MKTFFQIVHFCILLINPRTHEALLRVVLIYRALLGIIATLF